MQQRKLIIGGTVAVVGVVGWILFRPDLLFVNKTVNEGFPGATAAQASPMFFSLCLSACPPCLRDE